MTLVAGWKCRDGLVMAADTEITSEYACFQGHKLAQFTGGRTLDGGYSLIIGGAGDGSYVDMTTQNIRDVVDALPDPNMAEIIQAIKSAIYQVYTDHIYKFWNPNDEDSPDIALVIGVRDARSQLALFASSRTAVSEVGECVFRGLGSQVAQHLSERLYRSRLSVAAVSHIAQQFFREVKGKAVTVGGNTEIVSVRRDEQNAERFFQITQEHDRDRFLWGLDTLLMSTVRVALDKDSNPKALKQHIQTMAKRLSAIRRDCEAERKNNGEKQITTEFGSDWGNPYEDMVISPKRHRKD